MATFNIDLLPPPSKEDFVDPPEDPPTVTASISQPERSQDAASRSLSQPNTSETRVLTQEEIESLRPIFAEHGAPLPDPAMSFVVGEVQNGEVVAFLVIQFKVHGQPLWIKPGHEASYRRLTRTAEQVIQERTGGGFEVYVFADPGKIAQMAEVIGMKKEPWLVYSKMIPQVQKAAVPPPLPKKVSHPDGIEDTIQ